ncbi:hypothetical protein RFI_03802, partial [Reticulomyxa filosa]
LKILAEIEELKKDMIDKTTQMQIQDNDKQKMKEDIHKRFETIRLKEKKISERQSEIDKLQSENNQEILKLRCDMENIKTDFVEKAKQILLSCHEQREYICNKVPHKNSNDNSSKNEIDLHLFGSDRQSNTLIGHTGTVWGIDYGIFDDGKRFICSGSNDKTIRVWEADTTKQVGIAKMHSKDVYCVKFSSYHYHHKNCHSVICSASDDTTIRFWDFKTNKEIQTSKKKWAHPNGHTDGISSIEFSPFNGDCVRSVAFSPSHSEKDNANIHGAGYTICSGSTDNTIRVWDIGTYKHVITFQGHEDTVNCVKYLPCESKISGGANIICSVSYDKTVRLWDVRSKKQIQIFKGHKDEVYCIEYTSFEIGGAQAICSGSKDNTIRFWDVRTNKQLLKIQGNDNDHGIHCIQFLPLDKNNHNILCYGSGSGTIRFNIF